ncbi:MAG TPA: TolC family protein [Thermoanaerobaculia bacterium]|jgi:outer membrane protein TolC|nr:TolC family protein [Thermoanaerobaculia bacterium]
MTRHSTRLRSFSRSADRLPPRIAAAAILILVLASSTAPGDPLPAPVRLTLAEALGRAREASAHLAELRSLAAAAGAGLNGARAERLPKIDASASYTRQSDVPELRLTLPGVGTETVFPNIPDNYRGHLGLELPLYTSGRIANAVTANARQLTAANQDVQQGRADVEQETAAAYWSLVTARDSERVLAESLVDYDAHLKESRDRRDLGMAASNEVLAVQVQREQAELARLQAASSAAVANANLQRLLDLPPGTGIEPVEPLAEPAAAPPAAEPPEALVAAAEAARPEIVALRSRIAAGRANAAATRAGLWPQANLSAGYDYANPNPRILPLEPRWKGSWSVGAVVSLSLFDGGRTAAAAAQVDAQADALGHRLEDLERRVRLEVTQRLLELGTARQAAAVAVANLDSAHENVRVARDRYHEGVIPSSELLDAETALLRAGLDRTNALAQVRVALANLERAVGR